MSIGRRNSNFTIARPVCSDMRNSQTVVLCLCVLPDIYKRVDARKPLFCYICGSTCLSPSRCHCHLRKRNLLSGKPPCDTAGLCTSYGSVGRCLLKDLKGSERRELSILVFKQCHREQKWNPEFVFDFDISLRQADTTRIGSSPRGLCQRSTALRESIASAVIDCA